MEGINIYNYQSWLLDYSEGNLGESDILTLFAFLDQYPDLKSELENFENISFSFPDESLPKFAKKNLLKKNTSPDELLISFIENTISDPDKISLEKELSVNPLLVRELSVYKSTISVPDFSITFDSKSDLFKLTSSEKELIRHIENDLSPE
ncbi:MAG TPA: hypothetical protein VNX68_15940, partial [Nitrosopumilaceae archaeon]|nr:hypothetical protein [Nitrosopumilaceae archaeon]